MKIYIPIVALPPNLNLPDLRNGTETVVTPGAISLITATSSGLLGVVILSVIVCVCDGAVLFFVEYEFLCLCGIEDFEKL